MPDWKTRLAVSLQGPDGQTEITPIQSYTPTFGISAAPLHSLEASHLGVVYSPANLTFTMTVNAMGSAVAKLTLAALRGEVFDIVMQEKGAGGEWAFKQVVMGKCVITSAAPTAATVTGPPTATFSGFSLQTTVKTASGEAKVP
jgi:hypothetical protein